MTKRISERVFSSINSAIYVSFEEFFGLTKILIIVVTTVMKVNVKGSRERSKKRWFNVIEGDIRTAGVCANYVGDRVKWMLRTKVADPK